MYHSYNSAPTGVRGPINVTVITGFVIYVTWAEPSGFVGPLILYRLLAYNQDNSAVPPTVTEFNYTAKTLSGNIALKSRVLVPINNVTE